MNVNRWTWVAARSIGTSHIRARKGCDDFGACLEVTGSADTVLVAVASDGAGSACRSAIGSWITTRVFVQSAIEHVRQGHDLKSFSIDLAKEWIDDIRDRIGAAAARAAALPRDFAATLVGCLIGNESSVFIHVGDGASVFRRRGEPNWNVPTWPAQYAATTFFVTDEPEPNLQFAMVTGSIEEVAVFSDGLEKLVLEFSTRRVFAFF